MLGTSLITAHFSSTRRPTYYLVLAVAVGLTGCATPLAAAPPTSVSCSDSVAQGSTAVVVAATATRAEPQPRLPMALRVRLRASALQGVPTCVLVVAPDGSMRSMDIAPRRPSGDIDHGPDRANKVEGNLDQLNDVLGSLIERRPGLDVLRSIDTAIRRHVVPTSLFVISSGVSTADPIDLRKLGWDIPADSAAQLSSQQQLPDLSGWKLIFAGLGDTSSPQPPLTISLRERLDTWWTAVCRAADAADCTVDRELVSTAAPISRNDVPAVPLPAPIVTSSRVVIPGVLFAAESAVIDPAAESVLQGVVTRGSVTGSRLLVEGHTDAVTGTPAFNQRLSQQRAEAVAAWLVEHGLSARHISAVVGRGQSSADSSQERHNPRRIASDRNVVITFVAK